MRIVRTVGPSAVTAVTRKGRVVSTLGDPLTVDKQTGDLLLATGHWELASHKQPAKDI